MGYTANHKVRINANSFEAGEAIVRHDGDAAAIAQLLDAGAIAGTDDADVGDGLDGLTKAELVAIAAAEAVDHEPKANKDVVLAAIRAKRAEIAAAAAAATE